MYTAIIWGITAIAAIVGAFSIAASGLGPGLFFGGAIFFGGLAYLTPSLIAASRQHTNVVSILVLNLFLGWLLLPWVGALVWAFTRSEAAEALREQTYHAPSPPPAVPSQPAPSGTSVADELAKLHQLLKAEALTEDEFQEQKRQLLTPKT